MEKINQKQTLTGKNSLFGGKAHRIMEKILHIVKALWLRFWHCLWHTVKLDSRHLMYSEGISYTLNAGKVLKVAKSIPAVEIWFDPTHLGCTCGKDFYGKSKYEAHD